MIQCEIQGPRKALPDKTVIEEIEKKRRMMKKVQGEGVVISGGVEN